MPAGRVNATGDRFAPHAAETGGRAMSVHVTRRAFLLGGAVAASSLAPARQARGQAKATITYWNGLTGADGKVMDELIDRFTAESGIRIEQQRLPWAELYAKLQVAVPAGEGPDLDGHLELRVQLRPRQPLERKSTRLNFS